MFLQKHWIDIDRVVFDTHTHVENHTLHIHKDELEGVLSDSRFSRIDIELANPGEDCRLMNVGDIVQPVYKIGLGESTFPGVVDDILTVGQGSSIGLRGVAVVEILEMEVPLGTFIDMTGPAAPHTPFSKTINIAINAYPASHTSKNDYFDAMNGASKKAARYLAEAAKECKPDETEEFSLDIELKPGLPKVVYIFQIFSHAPYTDTRYYGDDCTKMMPLVIHPNEVLDGALTNRNYFQMTNSDPTFSYQNHPMILELYRRHGVDIHFQGVILHNAPHELTDKKRNAMMSANLARYHYHADAAVITKEGGGHPQIDLGLTCDNCENLGIQTAILITEFLSPDNASDESVLFTTRNANAMVSSSCLELVTSLPVQRVIGSTPIPTLTNLGKVDPYGSFELTNHKSRGATSQLGGTQYTSLKY